jgi:hypothetical protein
VIFDKLKAYLRLARSAQPVNHISLLLFSYTEGAEWEAAGLKLFADLFSSGEGGTGIPGHFEVLVAERGRRRGEGICRVISASYI